MGCGGWRRRRSQGWTRFLAWATSRWCCHLVQWSEGCKLLRFLLLLCSFLPKGYHRHYNCQIQRVLAGPNVPSSDTTDYLLSPQTPFLLGFQDTTLSRSSLSHQAPFSGSVHPAVLALAPASSFNTLSLGDLIRAIHSFKVSYICVSNCNVLTSRTISHFYLGCVHSILNSTHSKVISSSSSSKIPVPHPIFFLWEKPHFPKICPASRTPNLRGITHSPFRGHSKSISKPYQIYCLIGSWKCPLLISLLLVFRSLSSSGLLQSPSGEPHTTQQRNPLPTAFRTKSSLRNGKQGPLWASGSGCFPASTPTNAVHSSHHGGCWCRKVSSQPLRFPIPFSRAWTLVGSDDSPFVPLQHAITQGLLTLPLPRNCTLQEGSNLLPTIPLTLNI